MSIDLFAEFDVLDGHEERVAEMMRIQTGHVLAEDGNEVFLPFTRQDDPRHYVIVERYRDRVAFENHLASAHTAAFNAEIGGHIAGNGSELTWLDRFPHAT